MKTKHENIRVLIVDDELSGRRVLAGMLKRYFPDVEIVGEAASVREAVRQLQQLSVHLVFLDVEMTDGTGFDVLRQLPAPTFQVVFVTAYEQYAVQAFRHAAMDYLLKPINRQDLTSVLEKARRQMVQRSVEQLAEQVGGLMHQIELQKTQPLKIMIPVADGFRLIPLDDIVRAESDENYTWIHLRQEKAILVSRNLGDMEKDLCAHHFFRIHRKHVVNLNEVASYKKGRGGEVELSDGTLLPVSRERKTAFLNQLG